MSMSSQEYGSLAHQRGEFLATSGFFMYTDVNDRLLDALVGQHVPQIQTDTYEKYQREIVGRPHPEEVTADQAARSLYVAMTHFRNLVPVADEDFRAAHGFSAQDENEALKYRVFGLGLENMDFPWHFSAGLANAVADFLVEEKVLAPQQKETFTLCEWSRIIGSEWFGQLANSLALTARHTHRLFGYNLVDYQKGAFQKHLNESLATGEAALFQLEETSALNSDEISPPVQLSKLITYKLRERMKLSEQVNKGEPSTGCPVARKVVSLSTEMAESNPHVQHLLGRGTLRILDRSSVERTFLQQDNTTIDRTLGCIAGQLRSYEAAYGTPLLVDGNNSIWPRVVHQTV